MKSFKVINYLDMGIFPGTVMLASGFSYDEILANAKKHKLGDWITGIEAKEHLFKTAAYFAARVDIENTKTKKNKTLFFIYMRDQMTFTDWDYIALSHECLHICQFFLPDVLKRDNEYEAEAYLHSHLMKQSLNILRGKKK